MPCPAQPALFELHCGSLVVDPCERGVERLPGIFGGCGLLLLFDEGLHVIGARVIRQRPDDNGNREYDRAGALEEDLGAAEELHQHGLQVGSAKFGQHQCKRRFRAAQRGLANQERGEDAHDDAEHVQAEEYEPLQIQKAHRFRGHECRDQQRINRQSRRAGHERRRENGGDTVAPIRYDPRRHDARHGAGETRNHRDDRLPGETHGPHRAIHEVRGAREVAGILEQDDEQEQDHDLRQEDDHAADTRDDAVGDQARERTVAQRRMHPGTENRCARVDQVHYRRGPGKHGLENDGHHEEQPDGAGHRLVQPCRDACLPAIERRRLLNDLVEHLADPAIANASLDRKRRLVAEQLIAQPVQLGRGAVVEARQEFLLGFRRAVDQ